jgi:hypothetical protein
VQFHYKIKLIPISLLTALFTFTFSSFSLGGAFFNALDFYRGKNIYQSPIGLELDEGHLQAVLLIYLKEKNLKNVIKYMNWTGVEIYTDDLKKAQTHHLKYIHNDPVITAIWKEISLETNQSSMGVFFEQGSNLTKKNNYDIPHPAIILRNNHFSFRILFHEYVHYLISVSYQEKNAAPLQEIKITTAQNYAQYTEKLESNLIEFYKAKRNYERSRIYYNFFRFFLANDPLTQTREDFQNISQLILDVSSDQLDNIYEHAKAVHFNEIIAEAFTIRYLNKLRANINKKYIEKQLEELFIIIDPIIKLQNYILDQSDKLQIDLIDPYPTSKGGLNLFEKIEKESKSIIQAIMSR